MNQAFYSILSPFPLSLHASSSSNPFKSIVSSSFVCTLFNTISQFSLSSLTRKGKWALHGVGEKQHPVRFSNSSLSRLALSDTNNSTMILPQDNPLDMYEVLNAIGRGSFGEVLLVRHIETEALYAMKVLPKHSNTPESVMREVRAGVRLSHPAIPQMHDHMEDSENHYIIFEYFRGVDLFTYYEQRRFLPFTEEETKTIFIQILDAIMYCHSKGVVHLDIKLDNILINPKTRQIKIIDFGLCDFISDEEGDRFTRRCGSEEYCAAEFIESRLETPYSGKKIDTWCLGVVLYALLGASFPFESKQRRDVYLRGGKHPRVQFPFTVSVVAKELLTRMLDNNPATRISLDEVAEHPFLA